VIGAYDNNVERGAAYVFARSAGVWTEQAELTASDPDVNDFFGSAVAVEGVAVVVGATNDDDTGDESGSAYVFTYSDGPGASWPSWSRGKGNRTRDLANPPRSMSAWPSSGHPLAARELLGRPTCSRPSPNLRRSPCNSQA
jgi:hypothetical protein